MNDEDRSLLCLELQRMQRERIWHLKSRIMIANRLQATVAGHAFGYHSGMALNERKACFAKSAKMIKAIVSGEQSSPLDGMINAAQLSIDAFDDMKDALEKQMCEIARKLPCASWVELPPQRGFGIHLFSVLIGETGDLANYERPGKVWRRMGCAPFEKDGEMHMGSTWRKRSNAKNVTKLHAEDWEEFGYSPRRRSIAYLIGENFVKQNNGGPYRRRYDQAKLRFKQVHDEATPIHCHLHGMLLAAKLLMKNLWCEWNPEMAAEWQEQQFDCVH